MKSLLLAGVMIVASGAACLPTGAIGWWAIGPTNGCEIVTSNPVINAQVGGNIWFGSGPYNSKDDARLARSTISACPKKEIRPPKQKIRASPISAEPAAAFELIPGRRRIELLELSLQLLVDKQQGL